MLGPALGHGGTLQIGAVLERDAYERVAASLLNTKVKELLSVGMNNCFYEAKSFIEANGKFVIYFNGIGTRHVTRK